MQLAHGMNNEFANKGQNAWRILIEVAIKVVNPKYSKKYALAHETSCQLKFENPSKYIRYFSKIADIFSTAMTHHDCPNLPKNNKSTRCIWVFIVLEIYNLGSHMILKANQIQNCWQS